MTSDVETEYTRITQEVIPRTEQTYNKLIELYTQEHQGTIYCD
jgi:hypothetical protein